MNAVLSLSPPFILASQSPRRRTLLKQINLECRVQPSPADEALEDDPPPAETAWRLADRKATPVATANPGALVLAADTIVAHRGTILEKPTSPGHAVEMLQQLSNSDHSVYTGMALHHAETDRAVQTCEETRVSFATLSREEIEAYVATGSPMDKAGGYGIQDHTGPLFVETLHGDYYNVVGLPLRRLYRTLVDRFGDLLE